MTSLSPLPVAETVAKAAEFFAAEPAAVSLVAEVEGGFAAIAKSPDGAELVGVFTSEESALDALSR